MYLELNHQKLEIFSVAKRLVTECYSLTRGFPDTERYGLISQIRRASTSVLLNLAEGFSRRSAVERRRFYEISRGSLIEIDAALDISENLGFYSTSESAKIAELMQSMLRLLTALMRSTT